jgi:hypothetical protein
MNATAAAAETLEHATAAEEDRFDEAFRATRRVLDECIETLMVMERRATSSTRRNHLRQKRRELDVSRSDLIRESVAFQAGKSTMTPPSAALVARIIGLSNEAVALTAERTTVSAVMALATSALKEFSKIQEIDA